MTSQPPALQTKLDAIWNDYKIARDKAAVSNNIEDAVAAGRAWSRWLAEFVPDGAARDAVHGNVVVQLRK
jgi:hypothetical protein